MKLVELDPHFVKIKNDKEFDFVERIEEADGLEFLCPKCFKKNGGAEGTHPVICWQPHVEQRFNPKPARWFLRGNSLLDLSLVGETSPVIRLQSDPCAASFKIEHGEVKPA